MTDPETTTEDLDGHTIEELSEYLDRDCTPSDPTIDASPGCQLALRSLARLRSVAAALLEKEAATEQPRDDGWITSILVNISQESRAGREIPLTPPTEESRLVITEGAVRGIIRSVGDSLGTVLIGRCRLEGDVTVVGEPITVLIDAAVFWGAPIIQTVDRLRSEVLTQLDRHTHLIIAGIDITVHDITIREAPTPGDPIRGKNK